MIDTFWRKMIGSCELICGDCMEVLPNLLDGTVDMVLCDPPYGTTSCAWDLVLPIETMWRHYKRVCKGAVVLTAMQPFTSVLICSNLKQFKYCWVWDKVNKFTGSLNASHMPMLDYEDVAVFYEGKAAIYNKQLRHGTYITRHTTGRRGTGTTRNVDAQPDVGRLVEGLNPKRIISFPSHSTAKSLHPTQKPVALMEYMIRTYTNEGMVVLDNCMGSGTTGVACLRTGRKFIGIEKNPAYFKIAVERINKEYHGQTYLL